MTHDPLCPPMNKHHIYCPVWDFDNECDDCCRCDLIAQVLSDERINSLGTRVRELKPYAKGDAMTHDLLCPQQPRSDGATLTMLDGTPIYCACDLIAKARADQTERCIEAMAAVEGGYSLTLGMSVGMFIDAMRQEFIAAAMRALQEKP